MLHQLQIPILIARNRRRRLAVLATKAALASHLALSALGTICAQETALQESVAKPKFEVATVKRVGPVVIGPNVSGMTIGTRSTPGRITYRIMLAGVLQEAFGLEQFQLSGPRWINSELFEIQAKFPPDTSQAERRLMLQALLEERFGLTYHREMQEFPVYTLAVSKRGLKIQKADPGKEQRSVSRVGHIELKRATITSLAERLRAVLQLPVVDNSGVGGEFNITLDWEAELGGRIPDSAVGGEPAMNIFAAVETQLGLKLEKGKAKLPVLFIDHLAENPSES